MIFLWNAERVLAEIFELARLQISGLLKIPAEYIGVSVRIEDHKLKPSFQIEESNATNVTRDQIQAVTGDVWGKLKPELNARLASLREQRNG